MGFWSVLSFLCVKLQEKRQKKDSYKTKFSLEDNIHQLHHTQKQYSKFGGWVNFTHEFAKNTPKIHRKYTPFQEQN